MSVFCLVCLKNAEVLKLTVVFVNNGCILKISRVKVVSNYITGLLWFSLKECLVLRAMKKDSNSHKLFKTFNYFKLSLQLMIVVLSCKTVHHVSDFLVCSAICIN